MLSVIIPVYNVEKYLRKCVDSVLAQDIADMEVILIDDGSPDNCGAICDEYAEKDARVKVIHKENGGAATARNVGLDIAQGEFITFVDSDDYLLPNTYRPNLNYLENHSEVDCLQFPADYDERLVYTRRYKQQNEQRTLVGNEVFLNWWNGKKINHFVWNKIYKREIWKDLRFQNGVFAEDAMITAELSKRCKMVFLSLNGGYFYRYTEGSLMHSTWNKKKSLDFLKYKLLIWERMNELDYMDSVKIKAYIGTIKWLAMCSQKNYLNYKDYDEFLDSIPSIRLLPKSKELGVKGWIAFIVIKIIGPIRFVRLYKRLKGS